MNLARLERSLSPWQRDGGIRHRLRSGVRQYGDCAVNMRQVHRDSAGQFARIVAVQGWPGYTTAGEEGIRAVWLIATLVNCTPDLRCDFLRYLAVAVAHGDAPPR
jgi:hypothetical protein